MAPLSIGAVTEEDLSRRIADHAGWLNSGGKEGGRAHFRSWNLRYSNLFMARLERADLAGADLRHANAQWANFSGADLSRANLRGANLDRAVADRNTIWPEGFDPKAAGVIFY